MAKTPKPAAEALPEATDAEKAEAEALVEATMAKLFGEMAPEPAVHVALSAEAPAGGGPAPAAHDLEPVRDSKIDLESALSRLSTMRVSPIAIAGFDAQETKARRDRDTWEAYKDRFDALMNGRG